MKNDKSNDESKSEETNEKNASFTVGTEQKQTDASTLRNRKNSKKLANNDDFAGDPPQKRSPENSDRKTTTEHNDSELRKPLAVLVGHTPEAKSASQSSSSSSNTSPSQSPKRALSDAALRSSNLAGLSPRWEVRRSAIRSKSDSQVSRSGMLNVVIKSTLSSFKPLKLAMKKTTSIRVLKNYLHSRLGGAHQITLIHNDKELKNESGSLSSAGVTSGSVLWLLVKPVAGNNDREELASLIRMSQSLANLRNIIRALPSIDDSESNFSGSAEYVEVAAYGAKETEHVQMREKMKLLKQRREKIRSRHVKSPLENLQQKSGKERTAGEPSSRSSNTSSQSPSSTSCKSTIFVPPAFVIPKGTADAVTHKELSTYFDPPETAKQREFGSAELFDVPSNQSELLEIKDEVKNKRCGLCRTKLQVADREMHCICGHVFCNKHRNPQIHRCNIDLKSIDRVHIRTALPKVAKEIPKSKV